MANDSTNDGLLQVADVNPNDDGSVRVTIREMIGERGYLSRRMGAARALARRACYLTGATNVTTAVHWHYGCEYVTLTVHTR